FSAEAIAPALPALAFSPEAMYFNVTEGQNVGTRSFVVNVPAGTTDVPTVSLSSNQPWLTVPAAQAAGAGGLLQFNTAGLLAGGYTATVTASAPGYQTTTLPVSVTVAPVGQTADAIKVNFSDAATAAPLGFLRDFGKPYGLRTTAEQGTAAGSVAYTFGWKRRTDGALLDLSVGGTSNLGNGRNRNTSLDPDIDVRLATFMHMQANNVSGTFNGTKVEGYWEMQVPNGTYDVTVSAGDGQVGNVAADKEFHTLNVEGVNAFNRFESVGANGALTRFTANTVRVAVVDGALTINASETIGGVAYNGFNTKINSVVIQPVSSSPLLLFSPAQYTVNLPSGQTKTFKVNLNNSDEDPLSVQLTATQDGDTGAPAWLTFNGQVLSPANNVSYALGATGNELTFSVDATQLMARTEPYVARITAASPGYESSTLVLSVKVSNFNEGFRPYVTAVRPADGATNVSLSQSVSVELEFPSGNSIDGTTATPDRVLLYKVQGDELTLVTGTSVNSTAAGDAITLSAALELNTTYQFVITDQVKDANGYAMIPFTSRFTTIANAQDNPTDLTGVSFKEQILVDQTFGTDGFTTLVIGPDRRLYAATSGGKIERWDIKADGTLENHVTIAPFGASRRLLIGFVFDQAATAGNLVAWITHSSPAFEGATDWSGKLSRLNLTNPAAPQVTDYIINLPRSYKDHSSNSLAYGPDGALYFPQGSNAAMGAPDNSWGNRPERLLTASVLRFDIAKAVQQGLPLNAKTEEGGTYNPYAPNAPLTLYATGLRNAYDLVWHSNGELYVPTNGSAAGGNTPALLNGATWSDGSVYTGPTVPAMINVRDTQNDYLFRVVKGKYYGSPNPLRNEFILNGGNPSEGIDPGEVVWTDNLGVVRGYPVGTPVEPNYGGYAYDFELNKSPNGAIEYKSDAFGGKLKGKLLVCRFSGGDDLIVLQPGTVNKDIISATEGDKVPGFRRPFANPLDVVEDPVTGNLYISEYFDGNGDGKPRITLLIAAVPPVLAAKIEAPGQLIVSDPVAEDNLSGTASALETVTVRNTGTSPLVISSFALTGTDAAQFSLPGGTSGVTIAPGTSYNVPVAFSAASAGVKTASLFITSNHQGAAGHVTEVALRGLGTAGFDGTDEPSLQRVLDVHGLAVNAGDDDPASNVIHSSTIQQKAALLGDEVSVQSFVKAGNGPVTLQPLSVFGPTATDPIVRFGWYASTQPATAQAVFTVTNKNEAGAVEKRKGQTVNVQYTGLLSFDPANARFGFYSEWPFFSNRRLFSEDDLNTFSGAVPHHVRVYAVPGEANAYIIAFEEHISGFDYQDVVVIARNVKPYVPGTIAFSPVQLNFTAQQGNPEPPAAQTATVTVTGGAPNVTLTSDATWLTLPATGTPGAALSFGINVANLPAAGTYYANVTASANGYTAGTLQVALTVTPQAQTPLLSVNKTELILSGVKTGAYSGNITLKNEGTAPLALSSLALTGPNANLFTFGYVDEGQTATTGDIEPGQSRIVRVTFTPAGAVGPFSASLDLVTNATNTPSLSLGLYGMSTNGLEGLNEPPLAWVVQTLGYQVNVGWTGLTPPTDPVGAQPKGEEVLVPLFEKAGQGNVVITPVARYSPSLLLPFGFYTKSGSTPVRTAVGALSGGTGQHQTLFPQIASGSDQFDPGGSVFGLYVLGLQNRLTYTEDALNAGGPALHAARIYPMKNRQGQPAENSYLVCFEDASNGDYQDYMFVLTNVIPAGTRKTLAFAPQNLYFNVPEGGSAPAKTVTLTATNGSPANLALTKSASGNWLVLPAPAVGSLSLGV
ncbi:MAG TPA: choice-of-anchor D domain-containing protein, partial [Cytophagales bacterium]